MLCGIKKKPDVRAELRPHFVYHTDIHYFLFMSIMEDIIWICAQEVLHFYLCSYKKKSTLEISRPAKPSIFSKQIIYVFIYSFQVIVYHIVIFPSCFPLLMLQTSLMKTNMGGIVFCLLKFTAESHVQDSRAFKIWLNAFFFHMHWLYANYASTSTTIFTTKS